jgi:hypothetical protein
LTQGGFGLGEGGGAFFHALFQGGVELGERQQAFTHGDVGAYPFDMRPGAFGDFLHQRQVIGRPYARGFVVHGHQGCQASILDQWQAHSGRGAQGLKARGDLWGQFDAVVLHHQGLPARRRCTAVHQTPPGCSAP